jgi:hypothetical protein
MDLFYKIIFFLGTVASGMVSALSDDIHECASNLQHDQAYQRMITCIKGGAFCVDKEEIEHIFEDTLDDLSLEDTPLYHFKNLTLPVVLSTVPTLAIGVYCMYSCFKKSSSSESIVPVVGFIMSTVATLSFLGVEVLLGAIALKADTQQKEYDSYQQRSEIIKTLLKVQCAETV